MVWHIPPLACTEVWDDLALMTLLLEGGADPNAESRGNHVLGNAQIWNGQIKFACGPL